MFRLSGLPQIDAAEEKRRVREGVKTNVFSFVVLCAAIRIGKRFIAKHQMYLSRVDTIHTYQICIRLNISNILRLWSIRI